MGRTARVRAPAALLAILLGTAASAQAPPSGRAAAGAWTLTLEGSHRQCRLTLAVDAGGGERSLRFPATCRRAVPLAASLRGWDAPDARRIRLLDGEGRPVLAFEPERDGALLARSGQGDAYRLERSAMTGDQARRAAPPPPQTERVPQVTPVDPAKAPAAASLPGLYALDRYAERDVCRLALVPAPAGSPDVAAVRLLEGCRDAGIRLFDPVAWRYGEGRLRLLARRGGEVVLISERPNLWRRDPETGATLILRKMAGP